MLILLSIDRRNPTISLTSAKWWGIVFSHTESKIGYNIYHSRNSAHASVSIHRPEGLTSDNRSPAKLGGSIKMSMLFD